MNQRVLQIRTELAMTQEELGQALGLAGKDPGHTVRMWETGRRNITGPAWRCLEFMLMHRTLLYGAAGDIPYGILLRDDLKKMTMVES